MGCIRQETAWALIRQDLCVCDVPFSRDNFCFLVKSRHYNYTFYSKRLAELNTELCCRSGALNCQTLSLKTVIDTDR